jgi:hypothetical protein
MVTLRVRGDVAFDPAANPTVLSVTQQAIDTTLLQAGVVTPPTFTATASPNLVFVVQPTDTGSDEPFDPLVQVRAQDTSGAALPGVLITLSSGPGSPAGTELGGNQATTNVDGIATFTELTVAGPGTHTLVASAEGATSATSDPFDITAPATFVVNSTEDGNVLGMLRRAINDANSTPGLNTITFNIAGAGPHTIALSSPLPSITESVVIDGFSQPGSAVGAPTVVLSGADPDIGLGVSGLTLAGGSSTVQGLIIVNFPGPGITVSSSGNTVRANFIGTNTVGSTSLGNAQGVFLGSAATKNVIGGNAEADGNIIGGNSEFGLMIAGSENLVRGNTIGRRSFGIEGFIGVPNGNAGNGAAVVLVAPAQDNFIGGTDIVTLSNWIGTNDAPGIRFADGGSGNRFGRNSIFDNAGLGIDLGTLGVSANDVGDPPDSDSGPNGMQNFPVLSAATASPSHLSVTFSLASTPNTLGFRIEFFLTASCDASGNGEGGAFHAAVPVDLGPTGQEGFTVELPPTSAGQFLTATATNPGGSTSEFSACWLIQTPAPIPNDLMTGGWFF